ncbi:MAG: pilus assembly protein PilM [Planctomycetota bacterium]
MPIGLDVGASGVRLLQLSLKGQTASAVAAAFEPLPTGLKPGSDDYHTVLAAAIRSAMDRGAFTGQRVVSALPASMVQCKNLRLPMMPADELDSTVQWEAADRFRMGDGQCSAQYMHAGQVNQGDDLKQELILLAARLTEVEGHVTALTANGLRPVAIDAIPSALARFSVMQDAHQSPARDESTPHVVIDLGQSSTKVMLALNGQVRFYKPIEIGGDQFDSVLSGSMSLSLDQARDLRLSLASALLDDEAADAEAQDTRTKVLDALKPTLSELAREIGLCLRYYGVTFRGARPSHADLMGGAAADWLAAALGEATGLSLCLDGASQGVDWSAVRDVVRPGTEGAWAVAAGLSIREHMKHFNTHEEDGSESGSVFNSDGSEKGVAA